MREEGASDVTQLIEFINACVHCMCIGCVLDVYWMCIGCVLDVHWMCIGCELDVHWMWMLDLGLEMVLVNQNEVLCSD